MVKFLLAITRENLNHHNQLLSMSIIDGISLFSDIYVTIFFLSKVLE